MDQNFKNEIIKSLKKGGWPTELSATKIFHKKKWLIINNYIYFDSDKRINREIDIYAMKSSHHSLSHIIDLQVNLIVEVKKSEKPWVFFMTKNDFSTLDVSFFSVCSYKNINLLMVNNLSKSFPRKKVGYVSTSHTEAFRDSDISNIYKATDSVLKATYYFHSRNKLTRAQPLKEGERDETLFQPIDLKSPSRLHIYIPIILFQGLLLEAHLDKNSELDIQESQRIPCESYYIDDTKNEHSYIYEIIKLEYLDEYLLSVEKWMKEQEKQIIKARNAT